ncbi:MAG TPA: TolC family protein [Gemmatimonadaceae bacterium]|nr:TolC family protein [Gemmatimonadaceae bacterium]
MRRLLAGLALLAVAPVARAQTTPAPLSRADAVAAALDRGARLGVARADSAAAFAGVVSARGLLNPLLAASYSKATPNYHVTLELPFDLPGVRRTRIGAAAAASRAARLRLAYERAAVALDADTSYTLALAAAERARLARRTAADADSLRRIAVARRDAGDASDLDVELATLNAGQQENAASAASLAEAAALVELQGAIGLASDVVAVAPTDTLGPPPPLPSPTTRTAGLSLPVAAAEQSLVSAQLAARLQRRSVFTSPSLTAGVETGDPTGAEPGLLPTFGVAIPLPLLNRNRGAILLADAERERARAELTLAQVETRLRVGQAARERDAAVARVERDRRLVASASRVAAMSLTAYREGASSLPNVLEAQRNAREILAQYVDDLARAWIATASLRVFTLTTTAAPR